MIITRQNLVLSILCLLLCGCAQQSPAPVVAALPTTYKPILNPNLNSSRVAKKMHLHTDNPNWTWPAKGKVLRNLGSATAQKGLDIYGVEGTPVLAAADGEVVYSGNSLKGYGNLIIVKHKKNFLTAYAHNRKNMVKEGDRVIKGQHIADMGRSGTDKVKLHFEVRRDGVPLDPQGVLPRP